MLEGGSTSAKGRCHDNHFCPSLYGVYIGATWRRRLNRPCAAVMQPYVKLLSPLVVNIDPLYMVRQIKRGHLSFLIVTTEHMYN